MTRKKWKPKMTGKEHLEMMNAGYVVRGAWIMPGSFWEYYLLHAGAGTHEPCIKIAKSERACYNYWKRNLCA